MAVVAAFCGTPGPVVTIGTRVFLSLITGFSPFQTRRRRGAWLWSQWTQGRAAAGVSGELRHSEPRPHRVQVVVLSLRGTL